MEELSNLPTNEYYYNQRNVQRAYFDAMGDASWLRDAQRMGRQ